MIIKYPQGATPVHLFDWGHAASTSLIISFRAADRSGLCGLHPTSISWRSLLIAPVHRQIIIIITAHLTGILHITELKWWGYYLKGKFTQKVLCTHLYADGEFGEVFVDKKNICGASQQRTRCKTLLPPLLCGQASAPTSDGMHANVFSWTATVKISS